LLPSQQPSQAQDFDSQQQHFLGAAASAIAIGAIEPISRIAALVIWISFVFMV
jgi:hypothetical protein